MAELVGLVGLGWLGWVGLGWVGLGWVGWLGWLSHSRLVGWVDVGLVHPSLVFVSK